MNTTTWFFFDFFTFASFYFLCYLLFYVSTFYYTCYGRLSGLKITACGSCTWCTKTRCSNISRVARLNDCCGTVLLKNHWTTYTLEDLTEATAAKTVRIKTETVSTVLHPAPLRWNRTWWIFTFSCYLVTLLGYLVDKSSSLDGTTTTHINLLRKAYTVSDSIILEDNEFQESTTRCEITCFCISVLANGLNILLVWPRNSL